MNTKDNMIKTPEELHKALKEQCSDFKDTQARLSLKNIFADCQDSVKDGMVKRSLKATVELDALDLIEGAKESIPNGYNAFKWYLLAKIVFVLESGRSGAVHPEMINRIGKDWSFKFGREGSPVLYIRSKHNFWLETIQAIAKASKANEVLMTTDGWLRLWWD